MGSVDRGRPRWPATVARELLIVTPNELVNHLRKEELLQTRTSHRSFAYHSGRIIALGRLMLAILFLLAVWVDSSQPAQAPVVTYTLLIGYVALALALTVVAWGSWWFDARLAKGAHLVDVALFTVMVLSTNGYTSPFFLFFVFLLLSSAIRWGWRETAFTAIVLTTLYLTAGVLVAESGVPFELQRFIVRSGHLIILSALLIWFGVGRTLSNRAIAVAGMEESLSDDNRLETGAVMLAMRALGAKAGSLVLRPHGGGQYTGITICGGVQSPLTFDRSPLREISFAGTLLFDFAKDRILIILPQRRTRFGRATAFFNPTVQSTLPFAEGLAVPVRTATAEGWLFLGEIAALSADHVELGNQLGIQLSAHIQRQELLQSVEEGAAAAARLSLARDLHDSIVQFLAGTAFRLEAVRRALPAGDTTRLEVDDLKRMVLEEQREIRGYVAALRQGPDVNFDMVMNELRFLAARLSAQWSIDCSVDGRGATIQLPLRLHVDIQQIFREAVANSVRHGRADQVELKVVVDGTVVQLDITDNGTGFGAKQSKALPEPWSLRERVDRAGGSLMLVSEPGLTKLSIVLPVGQGTPSV